MHLFLVRVFIKPQKCTIKNCASTSTPTSLEPNAYACTCTHTHANKQNTHAQNQAKKKLIEMVNSEEYANLPAPVLNLGSGILGNQEQADLFPFFECFLDPQDTKGLEGGQGCSSPEHVDVLDDALFSPVTDFRQAVCACLMCSTCIFCAVLIDKCPCLCISRVCLSLCLCVYMYTYICLFQSWLVCNTS